MEHEDAWIIRAYCLALKRRGLSHNTIRQRESTLKTLLTRGPGFGANRQEIEEFLDQRPGMEIGTGMTAKSRACWLSHLRTFFAWAVEEGFVQENPTAKIKSPKVARRLPRPMPTQVLKAALKGSSVMLQCWLLLGAFGGLRCCEIAGLRREDVLAPEGLLRVTEAKGGYERLIPLHPKILGTLEALPMPDSGPLFRKPSGEQVNADYVSHTLSGHLHKLGISSTPHTLRHFFATKLLAQTHDIRVVQGALGHKDISSTAIYADWDREQARVGVDGINLD